MQTLEIISNSMTILTINSVNLNVYVEKSQVTHRINETIVDPFIWIIFLIWPMFSFGLRFKNVTDSSIENKWIVSLTLINFAAL